MEKFERIALLCLLITHLHLVQSSRYEGSTESDFARSSYIQMERSLWEKYVDKVSSLTTSERLYKIFNQHHMFIEQYLDAPYAADGFSVLSKFYEWNNIESDVKSIHSLFKDSFRHRLDLELGNNNDISGGKFDERANLDLAETVISDPLWPVNATLDKIQNNIYNQGLYYKAKSVRALASLTSPFHPNKVVKLLIQLTLLTHSRKRQSRSAHLNDRHNKFFTSFTMQSQ